MRDSTHTHTRKCTFINCGKRQKADQWLPGAGEGDGKWEVSANKYEDVGGDGNVLKLTVSMAAHPGNH